MTLAEQLPELLTIREAAAVLGVHPETLRRWDTQGKLRARRAGPRGARRYARRDILHFVHARNDDDPIRDAQRLLVDVARAISSSLDLHAVARTVVEAAARIVGCDRVAIYLLDATRTILEPMIATDVNDPGSVERLFLPNPIPVDALPLTRYVLSNPEPMIIADTETHPLSNPQLFRIFKTRTLININLSGPDGEVFGLMPFTWTDEPHPVTQDELFLAQSLGALAGVALSNARLFAQVEQERSRATVISDVVRGVNSGHNLNDTLHRVITRLVEQLDADEGSIWLAGSDDTQLIGAVETRAHSPSRVGAVMSIASAPNIARSVAQQAPLLVLFEERLGEEIPWFETLGSKASLFTPLVAQNKLVGMAFVNYLSTPPTLSSIDLRFTGVLGAQCALAIERAQLLEAAYTQAAELEAIFDAMLDAVVIVDPAGHTLKANAAMLHNVGEYSEPQTLEARLHTAAAGLSNGTVFDPQATPTARALAGEVVSNLEMMYTDAQGIERSVLLSSGPVRAPSGQIRAAVTVSRDITDVVLARRENEALVDSFRAKAAELETVISQMGEGIVIIDGDGQVKLVNKYAEALYGTADVHIATYGADTPYQLFHLNGQPFAKEDLLLHRAVHTGATMTNVEWLVRRADNTQVIVSGSATPIIGAQGERLGAVLVLRDVTQRRQIEAEKDQFLSIVSHELKTPLTTIKGLNDLARRKLLRGTQPSEIVQKLDVIAQQVRRMEGLIGDLLDIRRLETGVLPLTFTTLDLTLAVHEAVERAQAMTERHTIVAVADPPFGVLVRADRDRLDQVLDNVLSNAIKYSPEGGTIRLDLSCEDDQALVRIRDQGIGIPAAGRERLFERFYRGSNVLASEYGGLGIGLSLSRELVLKHNGTLVLEATSEQGSTFLLCLPRLPETETAGASANCA